MKLILVRHGETEENIKKIIQGQSLHGKLSSKGIEQSKKIAEDLKQRRIDIIYSSDLKRASNTSKIIAKFHKDSPLILTEELRERNWGEFEGKTKGEVGWDKISHKYHKGFEKPKNGEDLNEFHQRVKNFLDKIKMKHPSQTILVVCHKNFIRNLIGIIKQKKVVETYDFGFVYPDRVYEFEV